MLYNHSEPDDEKNIIVGMQIRSTRLEAGLTHEQLAIENGRSKHYISRLENNKSDIELLTLKKIVEAGLGKNLAIQISDRLWPKRYPWQALRFLTRGLRFTRQRGRR